MSLISAIIKKPVTMLIATLLLVVFSIFTASQLSVDFMPDVEISDLTVYTAYTGANPEEIEENITKPLEEAIRGVPNLDAITSESDSGSSSIRVAFDYGTGIDQNITNLQQRIDRVKDNLPDDAKAPIIYRFSTSDVPVVTFIVSSNRSNNDVRQYMDDNLLSYFEQTAGVANVEMRGGSNKKVFVETSVNRLNAFDLTLSNISSAIQNNGQRTSLGYIKTDVSDVAIVLDDKYQNLDELKNLVIAERVTDSGRRYFIKLSDIAEIRLGYDDASTITSFNGKPAVAVNVRKLTDANILDVADSVRNTISLVESIAPKDFNFTVISDNSDFIRNSMSAVSSSAMGGGVLAMLVLLLFLRNIRSVLVIAISMPISVLTTLMLMYFAGLTLNFMSLAGLALGVGMLVDNSVVVLEHIYNKRLRGAKLIPASEYGAKEMARPVLASTLTTVLVFAPLLLFQKELGTTGGFFAELSFTVVVSVLASYLVSTLVLPILTSKYIPLYRAKPKGILKRFSEFIERLLVAMNQSYQTRLAKMLKKPKRSILLIIVVALGLPLAWFFIKPIPFTFLPSFAPQGVEVILSFPSTMRLPEMNSYVNDFQKRTNFIFEENGVIGNKQVMITGREGQGGLGNMRPNRGYYIFYYEGDVTNAVHDKIVAQLLLYRKIYPGVRIRISSGGGGRRTSGNASDFSMEIKSNNYDKLREVATLYENLLEENFTDRLTNISLDQEESSLEYAINVDRELANSYGVSVAAIANEVRTAVSGANANKYKEGGDEYDILLRLNKEDRTRSDLTEQLYINSTTGVRLPLANLVSKKFELGVPEIRRSDFQRTIILTADLVGKYTTTEATADVKAFLDARARDESVSYIFTGEFEDTRKTARILGIVFLLAVLFIFGIIASQFESFLDPFIILFTIPLTFGGVIMIYKLTGNTISAFSLVGVVMLVGIAVNHGIVLVDYINLLRKRGYELMNGVIEAGGNRLQPILMTTATTVFGLLPIVLLNINGVELIKPLALTVVGGLSVSAFLSLFLIPLIYFQFHKKQKKSSIKRAEKRKRMEMYTIEGSTKFEKKA